MYCILVPDSNNLLFIFSVNKHTLNYKIMNTDGAFRKLCNFHMKNTNLNTFLGKVGYGLPKKSLMLSIKITLLERVSPPLFDLHFCCWRQAAKCV